MLELPFPPWDLSPNSTKDRRGLTRLRKSYKNDCHLLAKTIRPVFPNHKIPIAILFYPPNGNRRDRDNCLGAFKYGLDGIAAAWGIDDSRFGPVLFDMLEPAPPYGKIYFYIDNIDMIYNMMMKGQNHG